MENSEFSEARDFSLIEASKSLKELKDLQNLLNKIDELNAEIQAYKVKLGEI